jgi:hypothetical protein
MMEKRKVVSSEISSGTDKIITLQEKERIDRKRSWNRGKHAIKRTDFYSCPMMYVAEKLLVDFNETMNSEKRELRKKVMRDEIKSYHENKTWTLVEKPKYQKILSNRWVLIIKLTNL